jgi:radical SAM superfamily enzyme YgiQ (UPF0313 family)
VSRLSKYAEIFSKIHKYQISILGTFIFGMDGDTPGTLHERGNYIIHSNVDAYQTTIMTPLPGTEFYRQLYEDGRLIRVNYPGDWDSYQFFRVVFKPKLMSPEELFNTMVEVWTHIYQKRIIEWKAIRTFWQMRSWNLNRWFVRGWQATLWAYHTNWIYRNMVLGKSKQNKVKQLIRTP